MSLYILVPSSPQKESDGHTCDHTSLSLERLALLRGNLKRSHEEARMAGDRADVVDKKALS